MAQACERQADFSLSQTWTLPNNPSLPGIFTAGFDSYETRPLEVRKFVEEMNRVLSLKSQRSLV